MKSISLSWVQAITAVVPSGVIATAPGLAPTVSRGPTSLSVAVSIMATEPGGQPVGGRVLVYGTGEERPRILGGKRAAVVAEFEAVVAIEAAVSWTSRMMWMYRMVLPHSSSICGMRNELKGVFARKAGRRKWLR